jgi:protease-4
MSDRPPSRAARFFGGIWRFVEIVRRIISTLLLLIVLMLVWVMFTGRPAWTVENNVALVWAPVGTLVEAVDQTPEQMILQQLADAQPRQTVVRDLVKTLELAATDKRIRLVYLKLDELESAGMAQLQELGEAIRAFRKASGKKVIAYARDYGQEQYYLAAQADEVYMDPQGMVLMPGFGMYNLYFREALDKLGVDVHVFRVGEYKSAVEPFERNDMSPEAKASDTAWLGVLWDNYKNGVASQRKLKPEDLQQYAATFPALVEAQQGDTAAIAKASRLVDGLLTLNQMRAQVGAVVGMDDDNYSFRQIDNFSYLSAVGAKDQAPPDAPSIAIATAQGELIDGDSVLGATGGDTLADQIDQAINDNQVAALVLRIDSPGGSITASERIRREVERFRDTSRPVVVSMSSLAASGGYWIAVDADEIWAQDTTLTGSIGVFGLIPTFDKPLAKMGVHADGVGTTPMTAALHPIMPLQPEIARTVQLVVENDYRQFLNRVAKGRQKHVEDVDKIARGRVWSGADAMRLGLVDKIGGQQQAIEAAAKLAGLEKGGYRLEVLETKRRLTSALLERLSEGFAGAMKLPLPAWMTKLSRTLDWQGRLAWLNDPHGVYAHCMCVPTLGGRLH